MFAVDYWPWQVLAYEGFDLWLDGDRLMVAPADKIDSETAEYVRTNRAALVTVCEQVEDLAKIMKEKT